MKRISSEDIFKILVLIMFVYFLFILTKINENLKNGRYQFKSNSKGILDTQTGIIYFREKGQMIEHEYGSE